MRERKAVALPPAPTLFLSEARCVTKGCNEMKFTINGFSQQRAVELGLSAEDLLILRWFTDFQGTGGMLKFTTDDGVFAWVDYKTFLEDMPIVKCNKKNLALKFQRLVDAGVLKHRTIKQGGTFSAYWFGTNYDYLVDSNKGAASSNGVPKLGNPLPENGTRVYQNQENPFPENRQTNISLLDNQSTKNIKPSCRNCESSDEEIKPKKEKKVFDRDSNPHKLARLLAVCIQDNKPDASFPEATIQSWADEIDKLIRLDKAKVDDIADVIQWCQKDDFWKANILSGKKLRKHFLGLSIKALQK